MKQVTYLLSAIVLLSLAVFTSTIAMESGNAPYFTKIMAILSLGFMFASVFLAVGLFLKKKAAPEKKEEAKSKVIDFGKYVQFEDKNSEKARFNGRVIKAGNKNQDYLVLEKLA